MTLWHFIWYCGIQGFVTGANPAKCFGLSGVGGINAPGAENFGAGGIALIGKDMLGVGLVGRILDVAHIHEGINAFGKNCVLRLDLTGGEGDFFLFTKNNKDPIAKLDSAGNLYVRGTVIPNWNGQ